MDRKKEYTGFVRAAGVCSWHTGENQAEAAAKAVKQFKRDFKHVFKLKKNYEYKVMVYDTTDMPEWVIDYSGYLHPSCNQFDGKPVTDFEIVSVVA